jgi:copper chaperone CopZ
MQTTYLTITGITTGDPRREVTDILSELSGVGDVKVAASGGGVAIDFNEMRISVKRLISALEEAGFELDSAGLGHTRPRLSQGTPLE